MPITHFWEAVRQGWSPYLVKSGRSRLYHENFLAAERDAQALAIGIWDETINAGGAYRDYDRLIPWWYLRDSIVQRYREAGADAGVLSVRLDYEAIREAATAGDRLKVLCDLQAVISRWSCGRP